MYSIKLAGGPSACKGCCREGPPQCCKKSCRRIASAHIGLQRWQIGGLVPKHRSLHQPPVLAAFLATQKPAPGFSFNGGFHLPKILGLVPIQRKNKKSKTNIIPSVWVYVTGGFLYLNYGETGESGGEWLFGGE